MSTNCLVTKLKGIVDNDDLPILNAVTFQVQKVSSNDFYTKLIIYFDETSVTVRANGNGGFYESVSPLGTELKSKTYSGISSQTIYLKNETFTLSINDQNSITALNVTYVKADGTEANGGDMKIIDLADIKYCKNMTSLHVYKTAKGNISDISGLTNLNFLYLAWNTFEGNDISALKDYTKIKQAYFQNSNVSGDIIHLTKNISLDALYTNINMTGDIDEFVGALIDNGFKTNKNISFSPNTANITFGQYTLEIHSNYIIQVKSKQRIFAVANPGTIVYARGATQSEITDWENAGKTVYVVE